MCGNPQCDYSCIAENDSDYTVSVTFRITREDDALFSKIKERFGVRRSTLVRNALNFYIFALWATQNISALDVARLKEHGFVSKKILSLLNGI